MASENKIEPMDSKYDPNAIEQGIYSLWIDNNYFWNGIKRGIVEKELDWFYY